MTSSSLLKSKQTTVVFRYNFTSTHIQTQIPHCNGTYSRLNNTNLNVIELHTHTDSSFVLAPPSQVAPPPHDRTHQVLRDVLTSLLPHPLLPRVRLEAGRLPACSAVVEAPPTLLVPLPAA